MPFGSTDSYVAADANNTLRGLIRDNTDNSHTGDTNETSLASTTITAGVMTATGSLRGFAAGTTTGTTDTKDVKLVWGSLTLDTIDIAAGSANEWAFEFRISNTATGAQRIWVRAYDNGALQSGSPDYITATQDTTANVTLKVTGTLGGTTDTITQTMWEVDIVQIT